MADFCVQCSEELGAPLGYTDFEKPLVDHIQWVLCEGCDWVYGDSES